MKKRLLSLLLTGALCLSLSAPALAAGLENFQKTNTYTAGQFTDVPAGEWYAANVQAAYELGLMEGSSATTFNPSGNLTIAEALVLACRLHSTYVGDGATFIGNGGAWYQPYVDYAVETAILSPGTYSDYTATATRAQFASILAAALPAEALTAINSVTTLPDVAADAAYAPAVLSLYNAGVLTGSDAAGSFKPDTTIQRSEVATIVTRMADPSLRKTVTLSPAEGTGTQPSASGKKFDSTTITADDLQGTWYAHRDPATTSMSTLLQVDVEEEWIFKGDQCTYVSYSHTNGTYVYRPGTFTVTSAVSDTDPNTCLITLTISYGECYYNPKGYTKFERNDSYSGQTSRLTFQADLSAAEDSFVYEGSLFTRKEAQTVYPAYLAAFGGTEIWNPGDTNTEVFTFLVNLVQTQGEITKHGDFAGQYQYYLGAVPTKLDRQDLWWEYLYYDQESGNLVLQSSILNNDETTKYDWSNSAEYTLTLTPDLTQPYVVTYSSYGMVSEIWDDTTLTLADESATAYLDPATFTKDTESLPFATHEGFYESTLAMAEENCASIINNLLHDLNDTVLVPNGYSLKDLGFDIGYL